MGVDKIPRPCTCLSSISVSIFTGRLNLRRVGGSDNVLGLGRGLPSLACLAWLSGSERRQKRKSKRRPGHGGGAPGWQERRQPILSASRTEEVAESMSSERWEPGRFRGERGGQMRANLVERLDRGLDDLAQLRLGWTNGWPEDGRAGGPRLRSDGTWVLGTALLVGKPGKIRRVVQKGWALRCRRMH